MAFIKQLSEYNYTKRLFITNSLITNPLLAVLFYIKFKTHY